MASEPRSRATRRAGKISPARAAAFQILMQVEGGAHSTDALRARSSALEQRDAALVSELVLGCLRRQAQLDFLIASLAGRHPANLDLEVRLALRLGIYQLRYLKRVPAHAVVNESVELARHARKASAAGLVNAVLRKAVRANVQWPDEATELSMPAWLLDKWRSDFGARIARQIAEAFLQAPERFVRVPPAEEKDAIVQGLQPTEVQGCYLVPAGVRTTFRHQDISSQAVIPLLGLAEGQRFLDLCAAPGNKTVQALETQIVAVACDRELRRLRELMLPGCRRVVLDAARPLPFRQTFDRVLVDAPCSGTGTLGRNPEIRWRIQPEDLARQQARQCAIMRNALHILAPGGRLVYSTCSLEREENEDVVNRVISGSSGRLTVERSWRRLPGFDRGDGFYAAVITSEEPTTG